MKNKLFLFLIAFTIFIGCNKENDPEETELKLIYIWEHSYKYEDIKLSSGSTSVTFSYGSYMDGETFGKYTGNPGIVGYEITESRYESLKNSTIRAYINDIEINIANVSSTSWTMRKNMLFSTNIGQVTNIQANDNGKCYLSLSIQEYYDPQKWKKEDRIHDDLGIDPGDRNVKIEFYK